MTPWLIKCVSGREFIVYADDVETVEDRWIRRDGLLWDERSLSVSPCVVAPTISDVVDNRKTPGA